MDTDRYITPADLKSGMLKLKIKCVARERIDGRPRLVLYFDGFDKGLILTRQYVEDISAIHGRNQMVDDFFASPEGSEH